MTRQEYLQELKYELKNLPVEEQEEALEYYRGYFEDADDDEEVIKEFGSPEELAKTITEKFASVPSIRKSERNEKRDGAYGAFTNDEVRSLDISLGIAEIVMVEGETFSVDYRGIAPGDITTGLSPFGTFYIKNTAKIPDFTNWKHKDTDEFKPRILIKIPSGCELDLFKLHIGAGSFSAKTINFKSERSYIDVGAGNIILNNVEGGPANLKCGMGNITYSGKVTGLVKADCGMGNITMNLKGNPEDYSIYAHVALGSVKFNNIKKSGVGNIECTEQKRNHFSVNCGMGNVSIKMEKD